MEGVYVQLKVVEVCVVKLLWCVLHTELFNRGVVSEWGVSS